MEQSKKKNSITPQKAVEAGLGNPTQPNQDPLHNTADNRKILNLWANQVHIR